MNFDVDMCPRQGDNCTHFLKSYMLKDFVKKVLFFFLFKPKFVIKLE